MKITLSFSRCGLHINLQRSLFNTFALHLNIPFLYVGSYQDFGDTYHGIAFRAETKLEYRTTYGFWSFSAQLLGFGVTIVRQTDY